MSKVNLNKLSSPSPLQRGKACPRADESQILPLWRGPGEEKSGKNISLPPLGFPKYLVAICIALMSIWISCGDPTAATVETEMSDSTTVAVAVDSIDAGTGMIVAEGFEMVRQRCLTCHSSKLITQNRATRDGWEDMIRWMQQTQKLPDLGEAEDPILDYLAAHYAPEDQGRRAALKIDEWYEIEE